MFWILADRGERNLVRAERSLNRNAVHFLRTRPAFRSAQDNHRPQLPGLESLLGRAAGFCSRTLLNVAYLRITAIESGREELMNDCRIVAFHKMGGVAASLVQRD